MNKFDEFIDKAINVASSAGKKTGEMVEVSRYKLQVVQLNADVDKQFKRIGELIYNSRKNGNDNADEIDNAISIVENIKSQITELNNKINTSQALIRCDNCGASNNVDAIFCSRCGKTLTMKEPSSAQADTQGAEPYIEITIKEPTNGSDNK